MAAKGLIKYPQQGFPPITLMLAAQFVKATECKWVPKKDQQDCELTILPSNDVLRGVHTIARYFARSVPEVGLYGRDPLAASQVDMWIDNAAKVGRETKLEEFAEWVNGYLLLRTFFVGHEITLADLAVYGALKTSPQWAAFVESHGKSVPNLMRWMTYLESLPQFAEVLNTHFPKTSAAQPAPSKPAKGIAGWLANYDSLELPNARLGEVVTRFPPEPSGYMHIGHVKAAMLNNFYAERYQGKLILRFDDTNPSKEKDDYADNIKHDLKVLGIQQHVVSYTSDYFQKLEEFCVQLIKAGKVYVDNTPKEQMRKERSEGTESACRNNSVEENLRLWKEMQNGTEEGFKCVVRAKIDMKSPNGALRDPSLYRCNLDPHYRVGTKFKVYPLYDFACPIVDSLEGVTHALRSSEYHDRNPLYYWVVDAVGIRRPHIEDFSRLNFEFVLLSKRKLQWFVDNGIVEGWDDPRFPTVQGILRRGMTVEALREFILAQGASKALNLMTMDKLWAINKKIIDPVVPRYTALDSNNRVPFLLSNGPSTPSSRSVPRHKKNPSLGNKVVVHSNKIWLEGEDAKAIKENEEVTLMDWGNAIIRKINKDGSGNITSLEGELHLEGNFKTTEKKLTWLSDSDELVPIVLREYDYLITKKKLEEDEDFRQFVNPKSLYETFAVGDPGLRILNKGEHIQLERRGYFICDSPFMYPNKAMVLVMIPDGHVRSRASIAAEKGKDKEKDVKGKETEPAKGKGKAKGKNK